MTFRHRLSIVVLGAGVAGPAAALALARDGHAVTLVERDAVELRGPLDSIGWERKGIPHFLQPHAFTPRGRKEMRETFPDVFDALIEAGAWDLDLRPKMRGGTPRPDDEDLVFFGVRRPLIEWALRKAVLADPGIRVMEETRATGLHASRRADGEPPRISGVETSAGVVGADVVVDAMGRRSPAHGWLAALGAGAAVERSSDCQIIYYTRHYRIRDGATLPGTPSVPGVRGDLGYGAFSTFPGDNRTFSALIAVPPGDAELKVLRDARAFDAAARTMPALHAWTNPDTSEPITPVLPMGSLRNTRRAPADGQPGAIGLISVGDSVCHTDPVAALGLSFSLIHARHLATAVREHRSDVAQAALVFDALARHEMDERFEYVSAIDETRTRRWAGESVDFTHRDGGAYEFFTFAAAGIAGLADGDLFRVLVRRNYFLDPLSVLDEDEAMLARLEAFYADLAAMNRPPGGPARDELLEVMAAATRQATGGR